MGQRTERAPRRQTSGHQLLPEGGRCHWEGWQELKERPSLPSGSPGRNTFGHCISRQVVALSKARAKLNREGQLGEGLPSRRGLSGVEGERMEPKCFLP